jgi:hypothetical protein
MTVEQLLIAVFGVPSVSLLMGIYLKIGRFEAAQESLKAGLKDVKDEQRDLWSAVNRIKEKIA